MPSINTDCHLGIVPLVFENISSRVTYLLRYSLLRHCLDSLNAGIRTYQMTTIGTGMRTDTTPVGPWVTINS